MQHVLRCWERQSDLTTQYKKTLRRPGLRPDPARGAYNVATNTLAGVEAEGLAALPKKPILGPGLSYPHSKISSDAVADARYVCGS